MNAQVLEIAQPLGSSATRHHMFLLDFAVSILKRHSKPSDISTPDAKINTPENNLISSKVCCNPNQLNAFKANKSYLSSVL